MASGCGDFSAFFVPLPCNRFTPPNTMDYNLHTFGNGLRLVHNHDPYTSMVAVNVLYDVGSRDEHPELTGLAHLFEHLMFGGSRTAPSFDAAIERAGGWNNAWTSPDFTNFYDVAPASNVETLFWLEADRMEALTLDQRALDVQRGVVLEEFKQTCLNQPYGDLGHLLRGLIYTAHPYRHPTIGMEPGHIERMTLDDLNDFYYSHYAPNNAVLAVSGNVEWERTVDLVGKWFGGIPRREIAPRLYRPEPLPTRPRELTVRRDVPQGLVMVTYPMGAYGGKDYRPLDVATDLLASGESSRFFRRFTMADPLFTEAEASICGCEEPGYLMLMGRLTTSDAQSVERAREALIEEAMKLADPAAIGQVELTRALNRFESEQKFSSMSYLARAQNLARAVMHGEDINDCVARQRSVTIPMVADAVKATMDPTRMSTLAYLPK